MAFPPSAVAADKTNESAIDDDHPAHHNTLANAVNDITSEIQGWTVDRDANGKKLVDVGNVYLGAATDATGLAAGILIDRTITEAAAGSQAAIVVDDGVTLSTTAGATYIGLNAAPVITATANPALIIGLKFDPAISGSATTTAATGGQFRVSAGASHTITTGKALSAEVRSALGTMTLGIGLDIISSNSLGTFTTAVGLRITALAGGSTVWGMQVGDYQSYHHGRVTLGATTAPTYALDIKGTAQDRGVIALTETATPTNPASSSQVLVYAKSDAIVFGFNDAGTMRYKYLTLSGTGVTWTHSTTAP